MSERKETDKMSSQDPEVPMDWSNSDTSNKGPETEPPQDATGNSFNPHPSAGHRTQAQASHMSLGTSLNSDRRMDVDSAQFSTTPDKFPVRGQQPNAMGNYIDATQDNSTNPHPSAGQFAQVPQDTSNNTEVDQTGRHQDAQDTSLNIGRGMAVGSAQPQTSENKDEVRAILFVQWSDDDKLQKKKSTLQKVVQTLVNKFNGDCNVLNVSEDGKAEIRLKPAAAVSELQALLGKPMKGKDGKTVTITYISVTPPELDIQTPDSASMNRPPSSVSGQQNVKSQFGEQSDTTTSTRNVPMHTDNGSMSRPLSSVSEQHHVKGQLRDQNNMTSSTYAVPVLTDNAPLNHPPSSVSEPQHVTGQLGEQSNVTTSTNVQTPIDNDNSQQEVNLPSSSLSEQQHHQEPPVEQSGSSSSAAASTTEEKTCSCFLPVVHFWYVNHIFKEDIKRIEREHGVKMSAEVNVTFVGDQKDEGLKEALSEFTDLVQKRIGEFDGSVTPLKSLDTEEFKDALKIIQRPEHKLLVALSSEEITVYGPKPIPNAISKSLNAAQTSSVNTFNSAAESQDTSLNIGMSINDHLVNNGLTMQESHWKLMTTSFSDDVDKIKDKFRVDFKDSGIRHGKVNVKAHYKRSGGNASMESHAVRALLHLCQKITTSPKNVTQHQGATGFSDSTKNSSSVYPSEGASSGPVANSQSGYSTRNTDDSARKGATAGDNEDEDLCAICQDTFENKKQLKCKHEFCEECLKKSKKHMGPICPVCKDVFGVIEGTQPEGTMSVHKMFISLAGFEGCDAIVIDYYFPSGKQTERHPNPGQHYQGTSRTAYLPDNKEGKEVLRLLEKAFAQKLIFTVGTSTTSGMENQVTWNDIHHKTSITGGPQRFGYPDPDYLRRVRDELKAKGIE